jgi:DNA-binding CsgD family transcriptional regulator
MKTELEKLGIEYSELLDKQQFVEEDLDYSVLDFHRPFLDRLSRVNNSGITVFDLFRRTHVFTSYNFSEIFGYDMEAISNPGTSYFDSRIHPADFPELMRNGISLMKFFLAFKKEDLLLHKFVNEYRILGSEGQYIRVIEQHQALETDKHGNLWLSLGVIDISPDQSEFQGVKTQVFNHREGKVVPLELRNSSESLLSPREKEILQLVKSGFLSKEISSKLSISIHTVNTHRQRILEKLGAGNSMEAIQYAARLRLIR